MNDIRKDLTAELALALADERLRNVWRVRLASATFGGPERAVYLNAADAGDAEFTVVCAFSPVDKAHTRSVGARLRGVQSAQACLAEGRHPDPYARLFEVAVLGTWVEHPIFLLAEPGVLLALWMTHHPTAFADRRVAPDRTP